VEHDCRVLGVCFLELRGQARTRVVDSPMDKILEDHQPTPQARWASCAGDGSPLSATSFSALVAASFFDHARRASRRSAVRSLVAPRSPTRAGSPAAQLVRSPSRPGPMGPQGLEGSTNTRCRKNNTRGRFTSRNIGNRWACCRDARCHGATTTLPLPRRLARFLGRPGAVAHSDQSIPHAARG
jgi:hypothetical protein